MHADKIAIAKACQDAAHHDAMTFPQIVGRLMGEGFEGYAIDFRARTATYYGADGGSTALALPDPGAPIAVAFDAAIIKQAIGEAQRRAPGYTYRGFCKKVAAAGCAGYQVSFSGRRALYYGRTAKTHVDHFPD
jgi:uncharacterized protein YbcV (DUF1398 family)